MSDHLSPAMLNGLADGELTADQLAVANEHLAGCPACTSNALYQSLLKSATAKAGQRYTPPPQLQERLTRLASSGLEAQGAGTGHRYPQQWRFAWGWVAAAVLLLVSASTIMVQRTARKTEISSAEHAALVTEVFDQHVATLADSLPPEVVSTDRHTVKPWFQGKTDFSPPVPDLTNDGFVLVGGRLEVIHQQPTAAIVYKRRQHVISLYVSPSLGGEATPALQDLGGYHLLHWSQDRMSYWAVSDVASADLRDFANLIDQTKGNSR